MSANEEPSYLSFARASIRDNDGVSATVARELVARIDRDASALKASRPRTVTTREEVLALHEGAVLLDSAGDVAQLRGGLWCGYEASPMSPARQAKYIPATVLHEGEDRS